MLDIDMNVKIPPLNIQPLVENAVRHGVLKKANGGAIHIQIQKQADYIEVSIIDNGKGMTDEELQGLFIKKEHPQKRSNIGLKNINRRLKQLYGNGLIIKSAPNQGTIVTFQVPNKE